MILTMKVSECKKCKNPYVGKAQTKFVTLLLSWNLCLKSMADEALLIASAKISEREGSISPSTFYGQLPDY